MESDVADLDPSYYINTNLWYGDWTYIDIWIYDSHQAIDWWFNTWGNCNLTVEIMDDYNFNEFTMSQPYSADWVSSGNNTQENGFFIPPSTGWWYLVFKHDDMNGSNPSNIEADAWDLWVNFLDFNEFGHNEHEIQSTTNEVIHWGINTWNQSNLTVLIMNDVDYNAFQASRTYSPSHVQGYGNQTGGMFFPPSTGRWHVVFWRNDSSGPPSCPVDLWSWQTEHDAILDYGEHIAVSLDVLGNSTLSWNFDSSDGRITVYLMDQANYALFPSGNKTILSDGNWYNDGGSTSPPANGTWYVVLYHNDSSSQVLTGLDYNVGLEDAFEENDDHGYATPILVGMNYTGLYLMRYDWDYYRFNTSQGNILNITLTCNTSDNYFETRVENDTWTDYYDEWGGWWQDWGEIKSEELKYPDRLEILVHTEYTGDYFVKIKADENVQYNLTVTATPFNATVKWDWDVVPGQNLYWTLGYNVRMDFPEVVWESISDQMVSQMNGGMGMPMEYDYHLDLEWMYLEYMTNLPNSWHLKANIQQIGTGPLYYFCPVGDVIYADVTMKENTEPTYHFLDDAFMNIIEDMMNLLPFGGMMEYPELDPNMGLDLPLVQWPHSYQTPIGNIFFPLGGGGPLLPPAPIKPSNYSFVDFYDDLKFVFENNIDFGSNFIDFEDFIDQVGIINYNFTANGFSLEHDLLSATLDMNDIDDENFPVSTPVILELNQSLMPEIEAILGGLIILEDTTLTMNVSYDEQGVLENFHVVGELSATYYKDNTPEEYPLFMYFEIIVVEGVQSELTYMYDRPSQVEDIPGFPVITFLLFASLGIILVLRKVIRVKDKQVS